MRLLLPLLLLTLLPLTARAQAPANDDLADALLLESLPATDPGYRFTAADPEAGWEGTGCNIGGYPTAWYTFTPGATGSFFVSLTNPDPGGFHLTTIWTAADENAAQPSDLSLVYCDWTSSHSLTVSAGQTYYVGMANWQTDSDVVFSGDTELPVELAAFEARAAGRSAVLAWTTLEETGLTGFEVEHAAGDGPFGSAGFLAARGAGAYAFAAEDLAPGTHRFRLRGVGVEGAAWISREAVVTVAVPGVFVGAAHPNPFNPTTRFTVAVSAAQRVSVTVYDLTGRAVAALFDGPMAADQPRAFTFEAAGLPSGAYLVRVQGEGTVATRTLTLLK